MNPLRALKTRKRVTLSLWPDISAEDILCQVAQRTDAVLDYHALTRVIVAIQPSGQQFEIPVPWNGFTGTVRVPVRYREPVTVRPGDRPRALSA